MPAFVNWWNEILGRTAKNLSVEANTLLAAVVIAAVLVLFSFGVVVQVMMISREKKLSLGSAVSHAAASLWAIPVLAVLACFAFRVAAAPAVAPMVIDKPHDPTAETELRFEPQTQPPRWTAEDPVRRPADNFLMKTVLTARGASVADAERQLAAATARVLREEYPKDVAAGMSGAPQFTAETARPLVAQRFIQPGDEVVGKHRNKITQVYWELDLSEQNREAMRSELAGPRMWIIGGSIGLLAIVFVGIATYLRLDAATSGKYRFRLKLATTTLICASGLLLTALLPMA